MIRYTISASDCSKFLRVLYNSTYLNASSSQFALDLLSKASFSEGIKRALPSTVVVAHKFGEAGETVEPEFSETGIVYKGDSPYLITIMTKGMDTRLQAEAISEISELVFEKE
jgi:beta-lactamase class A